MFDAFWSLCQLCPGSMIESEKKNKIQFEFERDKWQGAISSQNIIQYPPESTELCDELGFSRRRKHPEMAYRNNDIIHAMNESLQIGNRNSGRGRTFTRAQNIQAFIPRSKSEGPQQRFSAKLKISQLDESLSNNSLTDCNQINVNQDETNDINLTRTDSNLEEAETNHTTETKKISSLNSEYQKQFRPFSNYHYIPETSSWKLTNKTKLNDSSWLQEVKALRKKAGEYKFRGWGSLTPDHLTQLYVKQVDALIHRSDLAALALDSTSFRSNLKDEQRNRSKDRVINVDRAKSATSSRRSATPKREAKLSYSQPRLLSASRPRPLTNTSAAPISSQSVPISTSKEKEIHISNSNYSSQEIIDLDNEFTSQNVILKSPPEPTRVKSPEDFAVGSPEPITWTVPLEAVREFNVHQNISDDSSLDHIHNVKHMLTNKNEAIGKDDKIIKDETNGCENTSTVHLPSYRILEAPID